MKRISLMLIAFTIAFGLNSVSAQSNKIVEQITKLEAEYTEASKKMSADDLARLETSDFMTTAMIPPRAESKTEQQARLKDVNYKPGTIESLTTEDVKVRVYGDSTAIVTGSWKRTSRSADGTNTSASGRFTRVWVKQNGKWLLAGAHYTPDVDLEKLKTGQTESRKN